MTNYKNAGIIFPSKSFYMSVSSFIQDWQYHNKKGKKTTEVVHSAQKRGTEPVSFVVSMYPCMQFSGNFWLH